MRAFSIVAVLALVILLCGCAPSKQERIQQRLDNFRSVLPEQARADFDAGNYDAVVQQVDTLLTSDEQFKAAWDSVKSAEAIDLFSTAQVVDFFAEYFVNYKDKK